MQCHISKGGSTKKLSHFMEKLTNWRDGDLLTCMQGRKHWGGRNWPLFIGSLPELRVVIARHKIKEMND